MASEKTLHCNVITPEHQVLECDATFVALPAFDGEIGFMHDRAPLLCRLSVGELRAETDTGLHRLFVNGGFAQMLENDLTVLTDHAKDAGEIDAATADEEMAQAMAMEVDGAVSRDARDWAIKRAMVLKRIASRH